ncbi:hypothetical protein Y032_0035g3034 [Ancylostoma ceylanicum]|uniref:SCP domain-containing protein n=1 Tax=Ancylostoma ceylanicum TaxID=53326 RepID=A0A016UKI8_9BILA|nr:hypothetical protein Y032_0035g3034 [Ancylostoma ceylanicum]
MRAASLATLVALQALLAVSLAAEFNCKNSLISEKWREEVLKLQNDNRMKLAQGKLVGKDNKQLPVAKDMNRLIWDCPLEDAAYELAEKCTEPVKAPANHGAVAKMIAAKPKDCDATSVVKQALKEIWKAGLAKQESQAKVADNNDFSQMAYSKTNGVGCSYNWCSGKLFSVCLYNQDGATQANLYTNGGAGETCKACADKCVEGLCTAPITPVAPATSVICPNAPQKDSKWITDDFRRAALGMHNYYRRLLATGWAEDKKLGYAKWAASMPELIYDCDSEEEIMKALKNCGGKEVANAKAQANNYKSFNEYQTPKEQVLQKAVDYWWSGLANTGIADNTFLDTMDATLKSYANMAFQDTLKVGCGIEVCQAQGWTEVQCGYVGTAITDGDPIYTIGKTCSKCGKLTPAMKCSPLGGLCVP